MAGQDKTARSKMTQIMYILSFHSPFLFPFVSSIILDVLWKRIYRFFFLLKKKNGRESEKGGRRKESE